MNFASLFLALVDIRSHCRTAFNAFSVLVFDIDSEPIFVFVLLVKKKLLESNFLQNPFVDSASSSPSSLFQAFFFQEQ